MGDNAVNTFRKTARRAVILYDEQCVVCARLARWVVRRDKNRAYECVGNRDRDTWRRLEVALSPARLNETVHLVSAGDIQVETGAKAVLSVLRGLPWPWRALGLAGSIPPLPYMLEPLYRWTARRRGAISRFLRL
ncbi:DUF393 domain-containing protein [bacterium]|nr:DUF393 domain-containing protein [bacterium]